MFALHFLQWKLLGKAIMHTQVHTPTALAEKPAYTHTQTYVQTHAHTHTNICTSHTNICTHAQTYAHTHIHIYRCTHTNPTSQPLKHGEQVAILLSGGTLVQ